MVSTNEMLYNLRTIKKLCKDVKLTESQKKVADEWLTLLEENKLDKEKKNYTKFERILLEDLLGYSMREIMPQEDNADYIFQSKKTTKGVVIEVKYLGKELDAIQRGYSKEKETPYKQTWNYMGQSGWDYGICTNYDDFWLLSSEEKTYNKNHKFKFSSIRHGKNQLNEEKLKEFIYCFSRQYLLEENTCEKLKQESILAEQEFTKEFYKLYHETRLMLIKEFRNNGMEKDTAIHWAQIFLNRLIFIFFAEDNYFIPQNLFTKRILDVLKSTSIHEQSNLVSSSIVELFKIMNVGSNIQSVYGFNGGLFEEPVPQNAFFTDLKDPDYFKDEKRNSKLSQKTLLAELSINVQITHGDMVSQLIKNLLIMDSYDFTTDANVNILGHIFEQSLSDLEELRGGITSRRKKEGVYYTPEYITDYICKNTIIPYLSKSGVNTIPELVKEYSNNIKELEDKIKEIKILDPACGSGAFLVKAVDVLLQIDEEMEKYRTSRVMDQSQLTEFNQQRRIYDIIENNIYGVDINEESVEITRLSLFLKLAGPNRKLINLSKNIKNGNSLIEDESVDLHAFDWRKKFPSIFFDEQIKLHEKEFTTKILDGFDIVIGNPPYGRYEMMTNNQKEFLKSQGNLGDTSDISESFVRKVLNELVKEGGYFSFIIPKGLSYVKSWTKTRKILLDDCDIRKLIDASKAFDDVLYEQMIFVLIKQQKHDNFIEIGSLRHHYIETSHLETKYFSDRIFPTGLSDEKISILKKIEINSIPVRNIATFWYGKGGLTPKINHEGEGVKLLTGKEISKYGFNFDIDPWYLEEKYLNKTDHERLSVKKVVVQDIVAHITQPIPHIKLTASLDEDKRFCLNTVMCFAEKENGCKNDFLLALINSKFMSFYYYFFIFNQAIRTMHFMPGYADYLPIPKEYKQFQDIISEKSRIMLSLTSEFNSVLRKFVIRLKTNYGLVKIPHACYSFYNADFNKLIHMLNLRKKLSLKQQDELQEYFEEYKDRLCKINNTMKITSDKIDELVYKSYNLTETEIKIIEKNTPE